MAVFLSPVGGAAAQFFTNSGVILSDGAYQSNYFRLRRARAWR